MKTHGVLPAALGAALFCLSAPPATAASACGESYTVRPGDWLSRVAERCGVDMDAIAALNPDLDPDQIERGQVIRLALPAPVIPAAAPVAPPAPPEKGPIQFTGEVVRDAGACLYVSDSEGRMFSFASGDKTLKTGMRITVSGDVVDNWFCASGAEVLVDAVEQAPAQVATLDSETL